LFPENGIASDAYEKIRETYMPPVVNSNIAIDSFPTLPISLGIVALFEQIYDGKPILTVFSNIGEDFTILLFQ
jgi:hypothetical protein